jgi:hypothetical protein
LRGRNTVFRMFADIRKAAADTLAEAGLPDKHPRHLKHAVIMEISRLGDRHENIVAYARHK